jgi:hypothetical protein
MTRISRHFNYTHRVRIPASKIHVEIERGEDGKNRGIVKKLDLTDHGRHAEQVWNAAHVIVEARRVSMGLYHRQVLGTIAEIRQKNKPITPIELAEFPDESEIVFRFKVVDPDKKLLGEVDGIRTGERADTEREPLIPLIPTDLKEELWRVDTSDEAVGPRVLVNKRLPNASGLLMRDPVLRGLILPQIVRQVLAEVATSDQQSEPWAANWISFADRLGHSELPDAEDDEAVRGWINDVVETFTIGLKMASAAETHMRAEEA